MVLLELTETRMYFGCWWNVINSRDCMTDMSTSVVAENVRERFIRLTKENRKGICNVYFRVEESRNNNCRYVIEHNVWEAENAQSYVGNDIQCFMWTLLGDYEFARKQIRAVRCYEKFIHHNGRREFVLIREREASRCGLEVIFRMIPTVVTESPRTLREPFLIAEFDEHGHVFPFKSLKEFLMEFPCQSGDTSFDYNSRAVDYVRPSMPRQKEVEWLNRCTEVNDSGGEIYVPHIEKYSSNSPFNYGNERKKVGPTEGKEEKKRKRCDQESS